MHIMYSSYMHKYAPSMDITSMDITSMYTHSIYIYTHLYQHKKGHIIPRYLQCHKLPNSSPTPTV